VRNLDGTVVDFVDPARADAATPQRIEQDARYMDCIDCHNRASHRYPPVEELLDQALFEGVISSELPFIKDQALNAVGDTSQAVGSEQYQQALTRIDGIKEFYRTQHADVFNRAGATVDQAVTTIKSIYQRSVFPRMNVAPSTYVSLNNHDGCFRCHGKLVGASPSNQGQMVGNACTTCHIDAPLDLALTEQP
jgi:hypothetical protein